MTEGYNPAESLGVQLLKLLGIDEAQVKEITLTLNTTLTREDIYVRLALSVPRVGGMIHQQFKTYRIVPKAEGDDGVQQ